MERILYNELLKWKDDSRRKPLILQGARQVGKTWLLKEFGKKEYESVAYINCDKNEKAQQIFESDFNTERIIREISSLTGQHILPGKTLIILDEIQEIPTAISSLKYFCEDANEYHVAVASSLLGLAIHTGVSFPVGKVNQITLYPLSFVEFIKAYDNEFTYQFLTESPLNELASLKAKFIELLRQYYFTGGMPEVVSAYVQNAPLQEVRAIQNQILSDYSNDISKHADQKSIQRIHQVWDSIPQQLIKENSKFVYGDIQKGARAKDFEIAIQWLIDAGLIYKIHRIKKAGIPLKFYEDFSAFKLFCVDCGLMAALCEAPISQILIGNNFFTEYKGAFTEQYVLQQLLTIKNNSIFYFSAENSRQELDFILQNENTIYPIEVKAEENLKAKSLHQFVLDHPKYKGIRFSMSDYREQDWLINIPLYAVFRLFQVPHP